MKYAIALGRLRKNLTLSRARLEQIQLRKLKALVTHAYKNVPYYRDLLDSVKLKPGDIQTLKDIRFIPVTDKATLRGLEEREKTSADINTENCLKMFTSGSTGMPTYIYYTREDYAVIDAAYLRSFLQNGLRFRYRRAFMLDPHSFETKKCWYHKLGLGTYTNISCFDSPEAQLQTLRKCKPDFIHGYPSSIVSVAKLMLEMNINDLKPRLVSTSAELLHKKERKTINSAFGVQVYDRYAARECGNIAWECDEHDGYHINIDTVVVEIIKNGKPAAAGEAGDVVVTNLHSYAMPFIRYRLGDIGILSKSECPCGIKFPLMKTVEGRDEDFIILKSGRKISPMMVTGTLDYVPGLKQFRVVQESMEEVSVLLAKGKGFNPETISLVEKGLQKILGSALKITCSAVDDIPRESKKVRAVISKVRGEGVTK